MTTTAHTPRREEQPGDTGRCQHCKQTRPVYPWSPAPLPWEDLPTSWLCPRDYSAAQDADEHDQPFHLDHDLIVWPEDEPRAQVHYAPAVASSGSLAGAREDCAR